MAAPNPALALSNDETISLMKAKAENPQFGDSFRIKVHRRRQNVAGITENLCTLDGATILHVANPETWLPRLYGGGPNYTIYVYHSLDPTALIGSPLQVQIQGAPFDRINYAELISSGWQGPSTLIYPDPKTAAQTTEQQSAAVTHLSPVASVGSGAPQTSVPGLLPQGASTNDPAVAAAWAQLETARRELDLRDRKIELERVQAQADARMQALEHRLLGQQKPSDLPALITAIGTALVPVITGFMQAQSESRREQQEQTKLLAQQNSEILKVVLSDKRDDAPMGKMMAAMTDTMSSAMKIQNNLMHQMADAGFGPPKEESTAMKVTREIVKGFNALAGSGALAGMAAGGLQPRLPAPKQPQLRAVKSPVVPVPRPAATPNATGGQAVNGTLAEQPAVAEAVAAVENVSDAAVVVGADGEVAEVSVVDRLIEMLRARVHPHSVVDLFFDAIDSEDEDLTAALQEFGGNPVTLFGARLGAEWISNLDNVVYAQTVGRELQAMAVARTAEQDASEGPEEDGDEDEEAQAV